MIDQAGYIAATRFCNQTHPDTPLVASLARLEECTFLAPMHIGEVAQVRAEVTFVAKHSMEVTVEVSASNPLTGESRRTNIARVWYVATPVDATVCRPAALPAMEYSNEDKLRAGTVRYEQQKKLRQTAADASAVVATCNSVRKDMMQLHVEPDSRVRHTVADSASSLVQLMLPSDCAGGRVQAGVIMKLMVQRSCVYCV